MKIRSKRHLQRCLGDAMDLSCFDFRTGKLNTHLLRQSKHNRSLPDGRNARCGDLNVSPPLRRTASIFRQPVTLIRTQKESKVKQELKHIPQEKPKQIFWEKRLEGIKATIIGHQGSENLNNYTLPKNFYPVGPDVRAETALRSLATCLHLNSGPITGQTAGKNVEKKPAIYLDPKQPLIGAVLVNEEDVRRQEERVNHLRRKLANLINEMEPR